jgi:acyl dehydratase
MIEYFEDLAVGQRRRAGPIPVTHEQVIDFGRSYDPQPMHTGDEEAKATLAGELIASGWHTVALTMRLMVDGAMPDGGGQTLGLGCKDLVWLRPVRPGDMLSAEGEIVGLRRTKSNPRQAVLTQRVVSSNQRGEAVLSMTLSAIIACRTDGS